MAYIHPSLKNNLFPTDVSPINQAIKAAGEPDPAKRDLRPLMALLSALPRAHPDLLADMVSMKSWITGWEWTIEPEMKEGETSSPEVELQRARDIKRRFRAAGLHRKFDALSNGRFIGISLLEAEWGVNEFRENAILKLSAVDAVDITPDPAAPTGLSRLVYPSYDSETASRQPYDEPSRIIVAQFNPLDGIDSEHWGGLLFSVLWYSWLQYVAWYYWMRSGERLGILTTPRNYQNQQAIGEAWTFLQNVVDHALKIPEELKVMVKEVLGNPPSHELFEKFIEKVDATRQRLIFGQSVVNSQTPTGSYAKAKEAGTTTMNNQWSFLLWLQDILSDQYVRVDYTLNYGMPTTGLFPVFRFITDAGEDFKTNASIISQLSSAGFSPVDDEEVSRKVGIKVKRTETPGVIP